MRIPGRDDVGKRDRREHVYMAGKITKHGWREDLAPVVGDWPGGSYETLQGAPVDWRADAGGFVYVGPYFVACDHGCYHSGAHGVGTGAPNADCLGVGTPSAAQTLALCRRWIEAATLVFAWIDAVDVHGTCWELGYAHAREIPIFVGYPTARIAREVWFPGVARVNENAIYGDHRVAWEACCYLRGIKAAA